jgi:hypothetical protein
MEKEASIGPHRPRREEKAKNITIRPENKIKVVRNPDSFPRKHPRT